MDEFVGGLGIKRLVINYLWLCSLFFVFVIVFWINFCLYICWMFLIFFYLFIIVYNYDNRDINKLNVIYVFDL